VLLFNDGGIERIGKREVERNLSSVCAKVTLSGLVRVVFKDACKLILMVFAITKAFHIAFWRHLRQSFNKVAKILVYPISAKVWKGIRVFWDYQNLICKKQP
jgi:hypothetical protein